MILCQMNKLHEMARNYNYNPLYLYQFMQIGYFNT